MKNKSEKGGDSTNMQFRPEKLEAPKVGTSSEQYVAYLGNYKMYLASLSALREEFWSGVRRQTISREKDVSVWGSIKVQAKSVPSSWSVQVDDHVVKADLSSEQDAFLYAAARCGDAGVQALQTFAKSPRGDIAPLKAVAALKDVVVRPSVLSPPPVSWATVTKVSPPLARTPPKVRSPEQLAIDKGKKAARRRRAKVRKAIKKTEEKTQTVTAKLALSKAESSLKSWTLVVNKRKARQARLLNKKRLKNKKSAPASVKAPSSKGKGPVGPKATVAAGSSDPKPSGSSVVSVLPQRVVPVVKPEPREMQQKVEVSAPPAPKKPSVKKRASKSKKAFFASNA